MILFSHNNRLILILLEIIKIIEERRINMNVLGIIAEYNPFHNGHLYHLLKSRELINPDYVICVISGHFTQRGEPALIDKWLRAESAIRSGIDLVLELPSAYATQTAELFAYGGVQILNHTGVVTHLSFGSEVGKIAPLAELSKLFNNEPWAFRKYLKHYLHKGFSFPKARFFALKHYLEESNSVSFGEDIKISILNPNSILAIEYLKALENTKSQIVPITVKRAETSYHDTEIKGKVASATSIRREIKTNSHSNLLNLVLPKDSYNILKKAMAEGRGPIHHDDFEQLAFGFLRSSAADEIYTWMDIEEGLENRIKRSAIQARNIHEFFDKAKTKRYVRTRLQRILIHGLLGLTKDKVSKFNNAGGPQYLRILGFSSRATPLLRMLKKKATLPIITKTAHYNRLNNTILEEMLDMDILASDLYFLAMDNTALRVGGHDFTENVVIV